jgi:hypothetical protein
MATTKPYVEIRFHDDFIRRASGRSQAVTEARRLGTSEAHRIWPDAGERPSVGQRHAMLTFVDGLGRRTPCGMVTA